MKGVASVGRFPDGERREGHRERGPTTVLHSLS